MDTNEEEPEVIDLHVTILVTTAHLQCRVSFLRYPQFAHAQLIHHYYPL